MIRSALIFLAPLLLAATSLPLSPDAIDALAAPKAKQAPGCAISIVQDGALAFARGYGLADLATGRAITPDTSFNVASMTKQFTAAAIGLLIAKGKLSETGDIRRFLPELRDYGAPITVANLLNHSSGLRNHMALAAFQPTDHLPTHAQALALVFRQSALNFAPGTRHQYESPNYVLLAEIVGRVSGMSHEAFLDRRILAPLGMTRSGFAESGRARAYAASRDGGFVLQEAVNKARGSSGLQSSVRDFARWMANYDRLKVGGPALRQRMLSTSTLVEGTPISYRYGLVKEPSYGGIPGLLRISHGGQTAAFRSVFSWFPGKGFGTVVLCNHTTDARAIEGPILDAWLKRQPRLATAAVVEPAEVPLDPTEVERLAGTYYDTIDDDIRDFEVKDGKLSLRYFGQSYPLAHRGDGRFGFFDQGEFRFTADADQSVSMREVMSGQAPLGFVKLTTPPSQKLADFAGRYRSTDVDGEVAVTVDGIGLTLRYGAGQARLRPIAVDRFSGPEDDFNHVAFARNAAGALTSLTLTVSSGITRMRFDRVAP